MPEDLQTLPKRRQLIKIATEQAQLGSHYLWGAMGEIPGEGSLKMVANTDNDVVSEQNYFTAQNEHKKCSGRHGIVNRKSRPVGDPNNPLHLANPDRYCWFRMVQFKYLNEIYGESCVGKRHFDCSGFANRCLMKVSKSFGNKRLKISEIRNLCETICASGVKNDDLCAADILVRDHDGHIGFAVGELTNKVVQAEYEYTGVVLNNTVGHWEFHGRLPKSYWLL
jgi:hypothetical protein